MFEPGTAPSIFAQAPGVDFPRAVVDGLRDRFAGQPPEAIARVTLFVNTQRMRRRLIDLFDDGPATLLPRIRLITDLGQDAAFADLPPAVSPLRRRLELAEQLAKLPTIAPSHGIYALADSLAALMDEMHGEGVSPEVLEQLDVSQHSRHWERSLAIIRVMDSFFGATSGEPLDLEARQRQVIERLVARWAINPPKDPVIVAGSTGSRGATSLLMQAVAQLPQGAVILPGFDFDMPDHVWNKMDDALAAEDHPQYRFRAFLAAVETDPTMVRHWHGTPAPAPRRNALVSLALRPAPVTDQWQLEGPDFAGITDACAGMTLIEAPSPRAEAGAIALILRNTAETGRAAALISPDRTLTRQVTAALDRWRIVPDDSAGRPLPLTAPGRLLRHVADLRGTRMTGVDLLTLLKHPLTHTGAGRGDHLRLTRDLELGELRRAMPFPSAEAMGEWAGAQEDRQIWTDWVVSILADLAKVGTLPLATHTTQTIAIAEALAAGSMATGSGALWEREPGRTAQRITDELLREADHGGDMTATEFRDIFTGVLNRGEVREVNEPHPDVMIWGTLEARVQGVDLVILGGLNDGTWPESPAPDPWMNRAMRHAAGLLLPERRIGLSAHDFQQAIGAPEVVLTRATRDAEAETVPSRWINRLTNLLAGMSDAGADELKSMRARGTHWLRLAEDLDAPQDVHKAPRAIRPAPQPPVDIRPKRLSFTAVAHLVRDPYAIYAQKILGLKPLDPLHQTPDAPLRGTAIHAVMQRFVTETPDIEPRAVARTRLLATAREVFEDHAPWPAARVLWLARLERIADVFLEAEDTRRAARTETFVELQGEADFLSPPFTIYGRADRIDRLRDGRLAIYDYKTGAIPSEKQQKAYDKQLLLEALVADSGGFKDIGATQTATVAYIGLGSDPKVSAVDIDPATLGRIQNELETLLTDFRDRGRGYTSRRVVFRAQDQFGGDYDHLARYGEWDHSDDPTPQEVGE